MKNFHKFGKCNFVKFMNFLNLFYGINLFSIVIPIAFGFFSKKYHSKALYFVWLFTFFNFFFTLISLIPVKSWFNLESNTFLLLIAALTNVILKFLIYSSLKINEKLLKLLSVSSIVAMIFFYFYFGYNFKTMTFFLLIEGLFTIFVTFNYLTSLHKIYKGDSLRNEPFFWISIGFMFSGFLNVFLNSFNSALLDYSPQLMRIIWTFFVPLTETTQYLLISYGFYLSKKYKGNF